MPAIISQFELRSGSLLVKMQCNLGTLQHGNTAARTLAWWQRIVGGSPGKWWVGAGHAT